MTRPSAAAGPEHAEALLAEARAQLTACKDDLMTRRGSAGMEHEQRLLALTELIGRIDRHLER